jgi:hypothetical protein
MAEVWTEGLRVWAVFVFFRGRSRGVRVFDTTFVWNGPVSPAAYRNSTHVVVIHFHLIHITARANLISTTPWLA